MAAVPITINGVLCDKYGRTITPCMIVGEASITGLGVGGGPIVPPDKPPGTGIWPNPPEGIAPHPEHPIVIPPPPIDPPSPPNMVKPPPPDGGWAYTPEWGWGYYPGPNEAGPK